MEEDKVLGLLCNKDRKFYTYEPGPGSDRSAIEKLRNHLLANGLIYNMDTSNHRMVAGYKVMSLRDARIEGLEVVVVYKNDHIRKNNQKAEDGINVWD